MSDQIDNLIREIAVKHGIAISRDDPIIVLQTINNRLMQDSSEAQRAQLDRFREEIEVISQRWQDDAKEKAERIITTSLTTAKETLDRAIRDGAGHAAAAIYDALNTILVQIQNETRRSRRNTALCFLSATLTLASVSTWFWLWR